MKWLKAGPELKLPDAENLRVPAFLEDLYYDLKDRRLLPLVALGIVAIIAVPFLLAGGSDKPEAHAPRVRGSIATASGADGSLTVVRSNPGLRDYRKRLHRKPTDPFKQHFTAPQLAGTKLGAGGEEAATASGSTTSSSTSTTVRSTATSVTTKTIREENGAVTSEGETHSSPGSQGSPSPGSETAGGATGGGGAEGGAGAEGGRSRWIAFAVDVRIKTAVTLPDGTVETDEPVTLSGVRSPAPLPTEKAPVVTYLGADLKTGKLVVMISEEVTSVFGEGKCLMGTQTCQLLEVETGMPTTFVYGPSSERYKITFTKIERVPIELPKNLEHSEESDVGSAPTPQARAVDGLRLGSGSPSN